jgi:uncharacterized phage protein (TIGR01671 family)
MREIKFRAWNGKRMSKPFTLQTVVRDVYTVGHGYREIPFAEETFMQYTGLHDKAGKEIFEGDVVKWDDESGGKYWRKGAVEWTESHWYILDVIGGGQYDFGAFIYECDGVLEIIGNIYKNPELISPKGE